MPAVVQIDLLQGIHAHRRFQAVLFPLNIARQRHRALFIGGPRLLLLARKLETFLEGQDFGKNWDGAYQDAVPTIRTYFDKQGFRTHIMPEWLSESRDTELVAEKEKLVVRIPWAEDYNGKSLVDLNALEVQSQRHHAAE